MIRVRRTCPLSWFHPQGQRVLGARLAERLCKRMKKGGLFLTLTYDRGAWRDARELYASQSAERHVRRFIDKLEGYLGASLKGLWLRKMEFQRDGWVHWHIVLDWRSRIPHDVLTKLWGKGHVWVNKCTAKRLRYLAKYVGKTLDDLPPWLLLEPTRSVKVIAVSSGFWRDDDESAGESGEIERVDSKADENGTDHRLPFYVPIGAAMERSRDAISVEYVDTTFASSEGGKVWYMHRQYRGLTLWDVAVLCEALGLSMVDDGDGWFSINAGQWSNDMLEEFADIERRRMNAAAEGRGSGPAAALHLTETLNPPDWLLRYWEAEGVAGWVNHQTRNQREAA